VFVLTSGVLCFGLEKDWFKTVSAKMKIPSYALLGVSISFAFTNSTIDLIQYLLDNGKYIYYKYFAPLSASRKQSQSH
jgi:hypothetical protein